MCVCMCGGGGRERQTESHRGIERGLFVCKDCEKDRGRKRQTGQRKTGVERDGTEKERETERDKWGRERQV